MILTSKKGNVMYNIKVGEEWLQNLSFSDLVELMNMPKESLKDTVEESLGVTDSINILKNTKS